MKALLVMLVAFGLIPDEYIIAIDCPAFRIYADIVIDEDGIDIVEWGT